MPSADKRYKLTTHWHVRAPIGRVWDALYAAEARPQWWKYVLAVIELTKVTPTESGRCAVMRSTVVDRPRRLIGEALGEPTGTGRWTCPAMRRAPVCSMTGKCKHSSLDECTGADHDTGVRWNHGQVMAAGGRGPAQHLGVELLR